MSPRDVEGLASTPLGDDKLSCGCEISDPRGGRPEVLFCGDGINCALTGYLRGYVWRIRRAAKED